MRTAIIKGVLVIIFIVSLIATGIFYSKWRVVEVNYKNLVQQDKRTRAVGSFMKVFVEKVIAGTQPISFEERLKMENDVRNLNDQDILDQWNKFVASKNDADAQGSVKGLLVVLANKAVK